MDEFGAMSQQRAVAAVERGHFEGEITPLTLPDGTVVSADDGPRPGAATRPQAYCRTSTTSPVIVSSSAAW